MNRGYPCHSSSIMISLQGTEELGQPKIYSMAAIREGEYMKQIEYADEQLLKMHADSTDWKTSKTTVRNFN